MFEQYVYLIESDNGLYKIGKTNDLAQRFWALINASSNRVRLIHSIKTNDASGVERELHNRFNEKRIRGEWFKLEQEDIRYIKSMARVTVKSPIMDYTQYDLALRLLDRCISKAGADSSRVPGSRDLRWSAQTWTRAIAILKPHVITKPGRSGGTYVAESHGTLGGLRSWLISSKRQ